MEIEQFLKQSGVTSITEYKKHYERGWRTSRRGTDGALDRANGEPMAWHNGYYDEGCGRSKWHQLNHDLGDWLSG